MTANRQVFHYPSLSGSTYFETRSRLWVDFLSSRLEGKPLEFATRCPVRLDSQGHIQAECRLCFPKVATIVISASHVPAPFPRGRE